MRIDAVILAVFDPLLVQALDRLTLQLIADGCDEDSAAEVIAAQKAVYAAWRADLMHKVSAGLPDP